MRPSWVGTISFLALIYWGAKFLTDLKQSQFALPPWFYAIGAWLALTMAVLFANYMSHKFRRYENHWIIWLGPTIVALGFYSFAHVFGIFGYERLGKVLGTFAGIVVIIVLVAYNDRTESKARKERRSLERKYREAGLIDDET